MASGRLRSTIPILRKIVTADAQRSPSLQRALLSPPLSNPEFSRSFSATAAPKEAKVKVPVTLYGLSGNYASALYIAAVKAKALEKVESELFDLVEASNHSPKFSEFMKDLSVPAKTRIKAITEIASQAKLTDVSRNFLVVLAENGRLTQIDKIAKRFKEITMAHKGEVKAIVTTVIPLPAEEEKELKETLQEVIGEGKTVYLEQKIDPSILGGLVVEFSQKVFDMSIRTRARQMDVIRSDPQYLMIRSTVPNDPQYLMMPKILIS